MKKAFVALVAAFGLFSFLLADAPEVKKAMKAFKATSKSARGLVRENKFTDPAFGKAVGEFRAAAEEFVAYRHPEAAFNEFNDRFHASVTNLDAVYKGGDAEKIKTAYAAVTSSCQKCHDKYKD